MHCCVTARSVVVDVSLDGTLGDIVGSALRALGQDDTVADVASRTLQVKGGGEVGSRDTLVSNTSLQTGAEVEMHAIETRHGNTQYYAQGIALSPSGRHLASIGSILTVTDTFNGTELWKTQLARARFAVAISPCGELLAHWGEMKLELRYTESGSLKATAEHYFECSVKFSQNQPFLVTGGAESITLWSFEGIRLKDVVAHTAFKVALSGTSLLYRKDYVLGSFCMETGEKKLSSLGASYACLEASGDYAVTANMGDVEVWEVECFRKKRVLEGEGALVTEVQLSIESGRVVAVDEDKQISVWSMATGSVRRFTPDTGGTSPSIALTKCGSWLFYSTDRGVRVAALDGLCKEME